MHLSCILHLLVGFIRNDIIEAFVGSKELTQLPVMLVYLRVCSTKLLIDLSHLIGQSRPYSLLLCDCLPRLSGSLLNFLDSQ